jgi:hypothetical protein
MLRSGSQQQALKLLPRELDAKDRAMLRMIVACVKVPGRVTDTMRKDVTEIYGEDGMQQIVQVAGLLGMFLVYPGLCYSIHVESLCLTAYLRSSL